MSATYTGAALRRRLRLELKRLRSQAEMTQRDVADKLEWSTSKVIRIEAGSVAISVTDLRALLSLYGIKDGSSKESELLDLARGSKRQPWSHYRGLLSDEAIQYMGYVSSASVIRIFQGGAVPGMLQTEEYTRALMGGAFGRKDDEIDEFVEFRAEYRNLLHQPHPPKIFFVLDEAVIRRVVGGSDVMQEQLQLLAKVAELPHVSIRILPFEAGAHVGLRGSFTFLSFPDPEDSDVVYMENPLGEAVFKDDEELTARYLDFFHDLELKAAPAGELTEYLDRASEKVRINMEKIEAQSTTEPLGRTPRREPQKGA